MTLVFVSYSRKDQDFVLRLAADLRTRGIPIWLDQQDIKPGDRWDRAVEKALEESTHFLLVVSQHSTDSDNVRDEIDIALDDKKVLIPILIDNCKPPLRVRRMQYTDFRGIYEDSLEKLLPVLPQSIQKAQNSGVRASQTVQLQPTKTSSNPLSPENAAQVQQLTEIQVPYLLHSVTFTPNSRWLAVGTQDGTILIWDVLKGEQIAELHGHSDTVHALAFNSFGNLASGGKDGTLALWNIPRTQPEWRVTTNTAVRCVAFDSAGGLLLVSGHHDGIIRRWRIGTGEALGNFEAHDDAVMGLAFSRDNLLASCGDDRAVKVWQVAPFSDDKLLRSIPSNSYILNVAISQISQDNEALAWGEFDNRIGLLPMNRIKSHAPEYLTGHGKAVRGLAFNRSGLLLASGSEDKTIRLWNVAQRACLTVLEAHTEPVRSVAFSPDGRLLASVGLDGAIRIWGASPVELK